MIRISHSLRTSFRVCPRQVYFRYHAGIVKRIDASPALVIGKCFHHGLELLRKKEPMSNVLTETSNKFLAESCDVMDLDKRLENDIKLRAYLLGYDLFFNESDRSYESEMQVDGDNTIAFIDATYVDNGRLVLVEDKTTASFNDDMAMILKMNDQTLWYWSELDRCGYDVASISYRETKKSAHKVNKKESLDDFKSRLAGLYLGCQETCYRETKIAYSCDQILSYRKMIKQIDDNLRATCDAFTDDFTSVPFNGFSCAGKWSTCAYLPICFDQNNIQNRYVLRDTYGPWDGGIFASQHDIESKAQYEEDAIDE